MVLGKYNLTFCFIHKKGVIQRDTRTRLDLPKLDLNVLPVYKAGITGRGIRITILDDGLEYTHDDLSPNYVSLCKIVAWKSKLLHFLPIQDPEISYNCNEENNDPMPRYELNKKSPNSHGTRCAGEVAMVANNKKCGVGIAFNARIGKQIITICSLSVLLHGFDLEILLLYLFKVESKC